MPIAKTPSSSIEVSSDFGPTGPRERPYLSRIYRILNDPKRLSRNRDLDRQEGERLPPRQS